MSDVSLSGRRIFVTLPWPGDALDRLRATGADVHVWPSDDAPPHDALVTEAKRSDALITTVGDPIDEAVCRAGEGRVQIIAQSGVGVDNIDREAAASRQIAVTNAPGVLTDATADLAFAVMMTVARRVVEADASVRNGEWSGWHPSGFLGADLKGATVGVVGLGRIGSAFARRCEGFEMRVLYTASSSKPDAEARGYEFMELNDLLEQSDIVSLHCPLTDATRGLIGANELARMKSGALLINTARGAVVDTAALLDSLRSGHLRGVGLDVTDPEPLPADHKLLSFPRVTVTPHIGSASEYARTAMIELAVDNVISVLSGGAPIHSVL
ncbi:MAG: D-glycerate dehydrogenase [Rubricoccaceae bacterium]